MKQKTIAMIFKALNNSGRYDDGLLRIEMDPLTKKIEVYLAGYFTLCCRTKVELADWLRDLPD